MQAALESNQEMQATLESNQEMQVGHGGSRLLQETFEDTLLEPTAAAAECVEPDMEFFECCEWPADAGGV